MYKIKKILIVLAILFLLFPVESRAFPCLFTDPLGIGHPLGCGGSSSSSSSSSNLADVADMGLPAGSIFGIIGNITYWIVGMFAFFGIIGFAVSGIMYLVSTGNDEMITKAKKYMMYSIVGVIVGLMGFVILQAATSLLEGTDSYF